METSNFVTKKEFQEFRDEIRAEFQTVLDALNAFSTDVDNRFAAIDRRFNKIESQMVTKDYLDRKLANLRSDVHQDMKTTVQHHVATMH